MENKKFDSVIEENKLKLSLDLNQDGDKLMNMEIDLSEAIQEALKKGAPIEGAKVVNFEFKGTNLVLEIDTDKDGESLMKIDINLAEALDEAGILK